MCVTPTVNVNHPTLISCIFPRREEAGNDEGHESPGNRRHESSGYFGGPGGDTWNDENYDGVKEITVAYGDCIDSIHVVYARDGEPDTFAEHGGGGGNANTKITLKYPNEYLVGVSGTYCEVPSINNLVLIRSLQFESNRRTFGPFGSEEGERRIPFTFNVTDGQQIVGLKGRSGQYLDAIGFYKADAPKRALFCRVKQSLKKLLPLSIFRCTGSQTSNDDGR